MKEMQEEAFPHEVSYRKDRSSLGEMTSLISQFNLFLDEQGVMRSKGHIDKNVELKYNVNPILVPKQHHLTKLLIYYAHC